MTETTQPDPQVVAWMHRHRASLGHLEHYAARVETVKAYRKACPEEALRLGLRALVDAYEAATRKATTLADIPAGQGPASLLRSHSSILYKERDGSLTCVHTFGGPMGSPAYCAFTDHLAATLPHVTVEDAP